MHVTKKVKTALHDIIYDHGLNPNGNITDGVWGPDVTKSLREAGLTVEHGGEVFASMELQEWLESSSTMDILRGLGLVDFLCAVGAGFLFGLLVGIVGALV